VSLRNAPDADRGRAAWYEPECPTRSGLDDRQDVLLADDEQVLIIELEFGAGVLRVQDLVALLDIDRFTLAVVQDPPRAGREDRPFLSGAAATTMASDTACWSDPSSMAPVVTGRRSLTHRLLPQPASGDISGSR